MESNQWPPQTPRSVQSFCSNTLEGPPCGMKIFRTENRLTTKKPDIWQVFLRKPLVQDKERSTTMPIKMADKNGDFKTVLSWVILAKESSPFPNMIPCIWFFSPNLNPKIYPYYIHNVFWRSYLLFLNPSFYLKISQASQAFHPCTCHCPWRLHTFITELWQMLLPNRATWGVAKR